MGKNEILPTHPSYPVVPVYYFGSGGGRNFNSEEFDMNPNEPEDGRDYDDSEIWPEEEVDT